MTELLLKSLDIDNFRSIRGHVHAPLDAKVVLLHGENGAGKTSLLSAIELALTGKVQSLERADPGYQKQLLHRSASKGRLALKTFDGATDSNYAAELSSAGASPIKTLEEARASFFRERVFLPQSLLGQLLQIYQDASSDAGSPLAQFVGKLLGLDRLDALEAGLKPLADVRNVRKNVEGWQEGENEKARLDRLLSDQRKARDLQTARLDQELAALKEICNALDLTVAIEADHLDDISEKLDGAADLDAFQSLADQQRRLSSITREIEVARGSDAPEAAASGGAAEQASRDYLGWEAEHGDRVANLRLRAQDLLSSTTLPSELAEFLTAALSGLETEKKQLDDRVTRARADIERHAAAQDEHDVAVRQRDTIDQEISKLSSRAGSLASLLAELSSFITDNICPVCERDYSETGSEPLSDHVHDRVRTLTASAERILTLGRTRGEAQAAIERLDREIDAISTRLLGEEALANLDRRLALIVAVAQDLLGAENIIREGGRLRAADVALRRVVAESQSRNVALTAARETLNDFAASIGAPMLTDGESFEEAASRFAELLTTGAARLEQRLSMRRRGADHIVVARAAIQRRKDIDEQMTKDLSAWERADQALERAQALREQGNGIRNAVDTVRSAIIRREFNDRLNRLWRDLFVRLAPGEPFVPAFRIPDSSTQRLQPKLITEHRDGGDAGGTPGAMLSAGNLNTAALTLFTALHLSVPKELPWLIFDDPVQSMDDVHIAHFAALLRTLSKEHGRQIMIAVHDRQLFEYLRLELSPAYSEDSLLTLELSRGPRRDSVCVSRRYSYKEETALLSAA